MKKNLSQNLNKLPIIIIAIDINKQITFYNNVAKQKFLFIDEMIDINNVIRSTELNKFIEESLSVDPPFFLTLLSGSDIGISIEQDTLESYVKYLNPGTELNLEGFISEAELLFTSTNKLRVRLNGIELSPIKNYLHPLRLIIKSSPPSFTARLYKPLN